MTKIAIIGAGIGGLSTAFFLEQKNSDLNIKIFEANDRIGGRIQVRQFDSIPLKYNAGVAELYRYQKDEKGLSNLENMVKFLGIEKIDLHGYPIMHLDKKVMKNKKELYDHYGDQTVNDIYSFIKLGKKFRPVDGFNAGSTLQDIDHPWFLRSFDDVLNDIGNEKAKQFLKIKVHCDLATEPVKTNGTFGFDNLLIDEPDYVNLYTLKGGNDHLVKRLYTKLKSAQVYLNSPIYGIRKIKDGYELTIRMNKKKTITQTFDKVIIAVAHPCLKKIDFTNLSKKIKRFYNHYDFDTHYLRVTLLFEDQFWKEIFNESYFVSDAFGGCCVYDQTEEREYGVLSWLISGENALELNPHSDRIIIDRVLRAIPKPIAKEARDKFIEAKVDRWINSVSRQPGGIPLLPMFERHYPDMKDNPNLLVVGDYLTDTTVNGSLHSARLVAGLITGQKT